MTNVVGIAIRTTASCPHLRGTVVDGATGALVRTFEHKASSGDAADQIHQVAQDFATELAAQSVTAVLVREVGFARPAGMTAPVKNRLRAEGACVGVARTVTAKVEVLDAKAIAHMLGTTGAKVDAVGKALTSGDWVESATAAVAAAEL